ncbi:MAG: glycerophosphodiester phosphodiesterase [Anaerolineae bacterium]
MNTWLKRLGIALVVLIGVLLAVSVALAGAARPAPMSPWFTPRTGEHRPLVFAHQGGGGIRPENTMESLRHAADIGADVLDSDMHLTKDGVLVLMHDETVDRTTNGHGAVADLTLAEIKALDAGYSFTTDGGKTFPYRGQGLVVPTVEEAFQAFPDKRFGLEIKDSPAGTPEAFCALVRRYNMQDKVLVSSFLDASMSAFRTACPEVATSATESEVRPLYILSQLYLERLLTPAYNSLQVPEYSGSTHVLTPRFVEAARNRGLAVQPWTIDEVADMERIRALNVEAINTNYPDRLLALLK